MNTFEEMIQSAKERERAGEWDKALSWYERAFRCLPRGADAVQAAELLRWIGTVRRERGDLELASEAYEASLAIAECSGLDAQVAAALNCLGIVEHLRGQVEPAEAFYRRGRALAVHLGDQALVTMIDQNLGALLNLRGDLDGALQSYGSALERSLDRGEISTALRTLNNMGLAHVDLENWADAELCFREAWQLAETVGDTLMTGMLELNRAELHLQQKQFPEAQQCCERSLAIFHRLRSKTWIAEAFKKHGILCRETGRGDQADAFFAMSLGLAEATENRLLQAEAQMEWALVHLAEDRKREGIIYLNRALRLFSSMQAQREVLDIRRRLERMEDLYLPAVMAWSAELLESKSRRRAQHARRVAELSAELAEALELGRWEVTVVRVGAWTHDIGHALLPFGPATDPEGSIGALSANKLHTIAGDALMSRFEFPPEVRAIVRGHHERFDGGGYPDAIAADAIPLAAQIVSVADTYDTLTHWNDLRPALSPEEALRHMEADCPGRFNPSLLQNFRRVISGIARETYAA